jgi:hypothetical protein
MRSKLLIWVVLMLPNILVSCATAPSYQAKAIDRSEGAVVRGWQSDGRFAFFTQTQIEKVDGLRLSGWSQAAGGALADPGVRVLSVSGTYASDLVGGRDTGRVEITATLKAGHTYRVKAECSGKVMTFWVEDGETHEAASERQSTNTTHWIRWL